MKINFVLALLLVVMSLIVISCENRTGAIASESSVTSSENNSVNSKASCALITQALNGVFETSYQRGTMTWSGGKEGQVEIAGIDYNDVTCTYTIPDCGSDVINMLCNQAAYNTTIEVYSVDSIKLGTTAYTRVK